MDLSQKLPPQNIEAENSVLGSILIDSEALIKIADELKSDDFYLEANKIIYEAIVDLFNDRQNIDLVSVSNKLQEKSQLDQIGGKANLANLTNAVVTASNIESYADIVKKKSALRKLIRAAGNILTLGYDESKKVEDILDKSEQELFSVSQQHLKQNFESIKSVLSDAFERIDELHKHEGGLRGVPTGFGDLDSKLAGLQKSDLIILAARPSVGKTSFALDIARNVAVNEKVPVGLFSLEMSKDQLVDRMLCSEAGIDLWKMRTGNLSTSPDSDDFPRLGQAMAKLSEAPVFIDDTASVNIMSIRTKARRLKMEHNVGLIVVDYLQLMEGRSSNSSDNRVQEIAEISRALKGLARELNVPVLALSQLSRAVEQSKPAIPKLSHLRESGSIEQDADVVMFIYRKSRDGNYRPEDVPPDEKNLAEVIIAKHRNGPTGVIKMFFDEQYASFRSLESKMTVSDIVSEF
ncbi:MAG: replicative DNA helicase [Patescibacteria group bacterium]